jgi:hypothetical protein
VEALESVIDPVAAIFQPFVRPLLAADPLVEQCDQESEVAQVYRASAPSESTRHPLTRHWFAGGPVSSRLGSAANQIALTSGAQCARGASRMRDSSGDLPDLATLAYLQNLLSKVGNKTYQGGGVVKAPPLSPNTCCRALAPTVQSDWLEKRAHDWGKRIPQHQSAEKGNLGAGDLV